MKKKTYWLFAGGAVCAGLILTYILLSRSPSLKEVQLKVIGCLKRRDSKCLVDYLWMYEAKQYGLTPQQVRSYFDSYVFSRFDSVDGGVLDESNSGHGLDARVSIRMKSGKSWPYTIVIAETNEGVKCVGAISQSLSQIAVERYYVPAAGIGNTIAKVQAWKRQAIEDRPELERLGIHGFYSEQMGGFLPWDVYTKNFDARLERARRALGAKKQP